MNSTSMNLRAMAIVIASALATGNVLAATATVTNDDDSGPGSFRAAVDAANTDPTIDTIVFDADYEIELSSGVHYTGAQDLEVAGNGSALIGDCAPAATWDGGLFYATTTADLHLHDLAFLESCNNGLAVFLPANAKGSVKLTLENIWVEASRFHGIYIDGQYTDDYNTDDVPHTACLDPWPYDSRAGIELNIEYLVVLDNGTLTGGWDSTTEFGCPRDFDGLRVDDGGAGGIGSWMQYAAFIDNLADGVEFDERGAGDIESTMIDVEAAGNGESGETDDGLEDLDDGIDFDEAGKGDLLAYFEDVSASENRDEGFDLDEAGDGNAWAVFNHVWANENEDEGVKVDEEDNGDLVVEIRDSEINGSLSQQGAEFTETQNGDLYVTIENTLVTANDDEGIAATQEDNGDGLIEAVDSDFTGNGDDSFDLDGVETDLTNTPIDG